MRELAGTASLVRLVIRRSRVLLGGWILAFVFMATYSAVAVKDLYPSVASRRQAAESLNATQSTVALFGRIYDTSSTGAIAMIKMGSFGSVFVALLATVVVMRHTRADEEEGRTELLLGTATGRFAPLAATLVVVGAASVVLAILTGAGLTAAGLPANGSFAFGVAWASVGLTFGAIAAVTGQLTASPRTATSFAGAVLGIVYTLRAIGDAAPVTGPRWLTWLSPIGWAQQFRPYAGNRWWVLVITVAFTAVATLAAFGLLARRDLGSGLLPARPGPATAAASLRSPLALAWRLQRAALAGWAVSFLVLGALLGNLASNVGDFLNSSTAQDFITKLGGQQGLTDAFLAAEFGISGVIASGFGIQAVARLRGEEIGLRAESLLSTPVSRLRWALSHIVLAVGGTTLLMALAGLGAGAAHAAQTGDAGQIPRIEAAALAQLPAAWVLVGIVVAAYGLGPRVVGVGWGALVFFVALGELGPLMNLGQVLLDLSPFTHVPRLPGAAFTATPLLVLTATALGTGVFGLAALRRRDIS